MSHVDTERFAVHPSPVTRFPVFELDANVPREQEEQLGSKRKFWFRHVDGQRWLFKYARPDTGEHWAEKVAAEIAAALELPHAVFELARFDGSWGAMTWDFTGEGKRALVHGNELLTELDPEYPTSNTYRLQAHTLGAVHTVLGQEFVEAPASAKLPRTLGPFGLFVGYLMLDALIGNTDRHHENWGVLLTSSDPRSAELAPTYDHASSLGRELTDEVRVRKYGTRPRQGDVARYFARARSALYWTPEAPSPMAPLAAFRAAAQLAPSAGQFWLNQLRTHQEGVKVVVDALPHEVISAGARGFCAQLVGTGIRSLLDLA